MALFFIFLVILIVLNNILLIINQSHFSKAQPSSSFKCLNTCTFMYDTSTPLSDGVKARWGWGQGFLGKSKKGTGSLEREDLYTVVWLNNLATTS